MVRTNVLSLLGTQVQSTVGELRSSKLQGIVKKKKEHTKCFRELQEHWLGMWKGYGEGETVNKRCFKRTSYHSEQLKFISIGKPWKWKTDISA